MEKIDEELLISYKNPGGKGKRIFILKALNKIKV